MNKINHMLTGTPFRDGYSYPNGDYIYQTEDSYWHLIRNGIDLLEGKYAVYCCSYANGDYIYAEILGNYGYHYHLIRDGVDLLKN